MALRHYKLDRIRSSKLSEFFTMAKSADTTSTKSSIISAKAASIKKAAKKSVKYKNIRTDYSLTGQQ